MTLATERKLLTTEDLLAIRDDGIERWLIDGELREGGMTRRRYKHSRVTPRIAHRLLQWLETQPQPRGDVLDGDAGFRLREGPDTSGIL